MLLFQLKVLFDKIRSEVQSHIKIHRMRKVALGTCPAASGTIRLELQRLRACFRHMVERVEPRATINTRSNTLRWLPPESLQDRVLDEEVAIIEKFALI